MPLALSDPAVKPQTPPHVTLEQSLVFLTPLFRVCTGEMDSRLTGSLQGAEEAKGVSSLLTGGQE